MNTQAWLLVIAQWCNSSYDYPKDVRECKVSLMKCVGKAKQETFAQCFVNALEVK
jgi:hypothetical protein